MSFKAPLLVILACGAVDALVCPMLGCAVSGSNIASSDTARQQQHPERRADWSAAQLLWTMTAAEGQVERLLCTSAHVDATALLVCGVDRGDPFATGTAGLVGVYANGTVAWKSDLLAQTTSTPMRSLNSPAGTVAVNSVSLGGVDAEGVSYGPTRPITLSGGSFALTATDNAILFALPRNESILSAFLFNDIPHASIPLMALGSDEPLVAIATPVVEGNRGYFLTRGTRTPTAQRSCHVIAIDGHRTLNDRLNISWSFSYTCPASYGTVVGSSEADEAPIVVQNGTVYFEARDAAGSAQLFALRDEGTSGKLVWSAPLSGLAGVAATAAPRLNSLALHPGEEASLWLTFRGTHGAAAAAAATARTAVKVGTVQGKVECFYAPPDGTTAMSIAGARLAVVPGMFGSSLAGTTDLALLVHSSGSGSGSNDVALLGLRHHKSAKEESIAVAFIVDRVVAAPHGGLGVQLVPLDDALIVTHGGNVTAVGVAAA